MSVSSPIAILTVAGGRGSRAGDGLPKQYRALFGKSILTRTLEALHAAAPEAALQVVIHPDDDALYADAVALLAPGAKARLLPPALGGASRRESARNGLEALASLAEAPEIVLIHDAARPFVDAGLVARAIDAARAHGAAVPGLPLTDTVKQVDGAGVVVATPDRAALRCVQTPQSFAFPLILSAHRAASAGAELTDDGMVAEAAGHKVHVFAGDPANFKLTTAEDFLRAQRQVLGDLSDIRTGQGYDVHAFGPGDKVWLGGVPVPYSRGLAGHSDADVLAHAITDALLGALADGDIGKHFPPSDPQWKGAASSIFLAYAAKRVRERGGIIAHVDATIVCEAPKIGPHRDAIRESLAKIMEVDVSRVAVKATTTERLGFTGRQEGMAALALATVRLPERPPM
ncbi:MULTISPECIES: bifunctional 2-C-methyl-D-erythritol 4-phosphate cytidylyltransferase/2-C-methyl-D-erythritol 2,4-cyclodiphosphate synthase [Methylosinus]|uniref:Bifunctional enzyme IspD/IspF n=1 Tax=Methylosinus trichosporium (strain ATCC 35070 / NCIMB 11131 / UNIQEM 75 / OB3b) TaxID=595536 RepID=A0A2D2CVS3_METT3|nr:MULTISPECIES: bifunctional 2-C-methyl-D-erythritol 4-phosphate cytidylyltransferase/2-C-methyl-D-erythritol 2,4-cyclodiphosphate synthase [Methylosinus]ATQ66746.1 bifunctional 2-C-methyl-D-erythritol 4-phosphate cytidylyltransferase/2-C-methyl-D-erythritol 2,4-cyclodiphosphate synthase [Methylosinus trichosporium OB3b]OBS51407.1 bifunctional 2-C-methyl-D-erythritol 4-phosphate cytidylyltransferase/2-C-methyl-D-erythritol 2,4-cyclodiphosphate synthase [Methylosinus sp. 3S-1]